MAKADEAGGAAAATARPWESRAALIRIACAASALVLTLTVAVPRAGAQEEAPPAAPAAPAPGGASGTPGAAGEAAPQLPQAPEGGQPAANPQQGREWTIVPSVSASEEFTDNVNFTAKGRQSDALTELTPGLYINGDTPRLSATFNYNPTAIEHVQATDQNQFIQNMAGNGTLAIVPDLFFFDGYATSVNEDRAGGFGYGNQAQIPTSLSTQTTAYSGSPYLQFHFGDFGDEEVRYTLSQTVFSGNTGTIAGPVTGTNLGSISNSIQQELLSKFTTGEGLGRLKLTASNDYIDFSSADSLSSRQETTSVNAQYNISGPYSALSQVGYQRLVFAQESPLNFTGPIWSVGGQYQPRDDRLISLTYGLNQGEYGYTGNVQYAVTPLTTVTASYTYQTLTEQQQILQGLGNTAQTAPGNPTNPATGGTVPTQNPTQAGNGTLINPTTGLPTAIQNPNLALQNAALRVHSLLAGVTMQGGERNFYSLNFNRTEDLAVTAGGLSQTTTGGYLTWNRDMSPYTQGTLSAGYADNISSAVGTGTSAHIGILTFTAGLTYSLSDTLTAATTYSLTRQNGGSTGPVLVDLLMVTLSKSF